jgi:C-terminal processing protease CtpA/Prc
MICHEGSLKMNTRKWLVSLSLMLGLVILAIGCQTQPTPNSIPPTPTLTPLSFEMRNKVFEFVSKTVKDRYVYADFGGVDWEAVHAEFAPQVSSADGASAFYALMQEMVNRLPDKTSNFQTPQDVAAATTAPQGTPLYGIGAEIKTVPEGGLITGLVPNAPAAQAGLMPREMILEVNGTPFRDEPAFGPGGPVALIRGPAGTAVELKVQALDGTARTVKIVREPITDFSALRVPRVLRLPNTNVTYVELKATYPGMDEDIQRALDKFAPDGKLDGVVLDLRSYTGGLVSAMFDTLGLFMDSQVIGQEVTRDSKQDLNLTGNAKTPALKQVPLVVVVSDETQPWIPAILQKFKRAKILGVPTQAASEEADQISLDDGSLLVLATRALVFPDGTRLGNVQPDRVVDEKWYLVPFEKDPQIQAALEELTKS